LDRAVYSEQSISRYIFHYSRCHGCYSMCINSFDVCDRLTAAGTRPAARAAECESSEKLLKTALSVSTKAAQKQPTTTTHTDI